MPSAIPDINCFHGDPYLGADGAWHCQGDTVPPATNAQIRRTALPPFIKMSMMLPPIKVDPIDPAPTVTTQTLDIKNCRRRQAPQNYTYIWNGSSCVLVALADAPAYIRQLQHVGIDNNTSTGNNALGAVGANLGALISQHPVLVLAAVGGLAYVFAGRGMKPKSREVVSTTRY